MVGDISAAAASAINSAATATIGACAGTSRRTIEIGGTEAPGFANSEVDADLTGTGLGIPRNDSRANQRIGIQEADAASGIGWELTVSFDLGAMTYQGKPEL